MCSKQGGSILRGIDGNVSFTVIIFYLNIPVFFDHTLYYGSKWGELQHVLLLFVISGVPY